LLTAASFQDYRDIINKFLIQNEIDIFEHEYHPHRLTLVITTSSSEKALSPVVVVVVVCSHVIWMGDLNYRIEGLDSVVRKKVRDQDFAYLFERDQVLHIRANQKRKRVSYILLFFFPNEIQSCEHKC